MCVTAVGQSSHSRGNEMAKPPDLPFPPLALVVQSAPVVLHVPVESRQHVRRQERAVGLKVLPGSLPDLISPGWCMPALEGHVGHGRDEPNASGANGDLTKN